SAWEDVSEDDDDDDDDDDVGILTDDVIRWQLRVAMSELEMKLGIPFSIQVCKSAPVDDGLIKGRDYDKIVPRMPYTVDSAWEWYRMTLPGSVISVERVRAFYFNQMIWEFTPENGGAENIKLEWPRQGSVHLLPNEFTSVFLGPGPLFWGSGAVWQAIHQINQPVPDFWAVDYTIGPVTRDGQVGQLEDVLIDWVYCVAGMKLFSIEGIARSKGLSSASVSLDGVSRSVGLQASAIYGLNSALEHVLDEATKRIDWKRIRTSKRGLQAYMYGGG
ncbi:MAG: hypothetical protein ACPGVG_15800, partial [Mycobacterium sp.]